MHVDASKCHACLAHTHTTCSHTTGAGRRGTWRHRPSGFSLVVRLGPHWRRGRRGCVCAWACARACVRAGVGVGVGVAGVALGSRRGTWKQAWHSATSTFMLCGGHGTYGTSYVHPPPSSKNSHVLFQMHSINLLTHNLLTRNSLTRSVFRHLLSLSCLSHPVFTFLLRLIWTLDSVPIIQRLFHGNSSQQSGDPSENSENQCSNTLAPRKKPSQACAGKGQKASWISRKRILLCRRMLVHKTKLHPCRKQCGVVTTCCNRTWVIRHPLTPARRTTKQNKKFPRRLQIWDALVNLVNLQISKDINSPEVFAAKPTGKHVGMRMSIWISWVSSCYRFSSAHQSALFCLSLLNFVFFALLFFPLAICVFSFASALILLHPSHWPFVRCGRDQWWNCFT